MERHLRPRHQDARKALPEGDVLSRHLLVLTTPRTPLELDSRRTIRTPRSTREEITNASAHYKERKREANAMDFDDLLLNWKLLLDEHTEDRRAAQRRVPPRPRRRVPGHEQAPGRPRRRLAADPGNVTVVGDDASRSTPSAARRSRTSSTSRGATPRRRSTSSRRTTARPRRSSARQRDHRARTATSSPRS